MRKHVLVLDTLATTYWLNKPPTSNFLFYSFHFTLVDKNIAIRVISLSLFQFLFLLWSHCVKSPSQQNACFIAKACYRTELHKELFLLTAVQSALDCFFPHALLMLGGFHHTGLCLGDPELPAKHIRNLLEAFLASSILAEIWQCQSTLYTFRRASRKAQQKSRQHIIQHWVTDPQIYKNKTHFFTFKTIFIFSIPEY